MRISREVEQERALLDYVEHFKNKAKVMEVVELYEFYLLQKAYELVKAENAQLKEELRALKESDVKT